MQAQKLTPLSTYRMLNTSFWCRPFFVQSPHTCSHHAERVDISEDGPNGMRDEQRQTYAFAFGKIVYWVHALAHTYIRLSVHRLRRGNG